MTTNRGTRQKQDHGESEGLREGKMCLHGSLGHRTISPDTEPFQCFCGSSLGLVLPPDGLSGAFSARMLKLRGDPLVKAAPVRRTLRSMKSRN